MTWAFGVIFAFVVPSLFGSQQRKVQNVAQIDDDIHKIVGGHFTPDAFGPDVYDAVLSRVKADPRAYLDTFETLFLSTNFDAQAQSSLYLPSFLKIIYPLAPERARASATRLLKQYNAVLVVYDDARDKDALFRLLPEETVRMIQRLDIRRKELHALLSPPK